MSEEIKTEIEIPELKNIFFRDTTYNINNIEIDGKGVGYLSFPEYLTNANVFGHTRRTQEGDFVELSSGGVKGKTYSICTKEGTGRDYKNGLHKMKLCNFFVRHSCIGVFIERYNCFSNLYSYYNNNVFKSIFEQTHKKIPETTVTREKYRIEVIFINFIVDKLFKLDDLFRQLMTKDSDARRHILNNKDDVKQEYIDQTCYAVLEEDEKANGEISLSSSMILNLDKIKKQYKVINNMIDKAFTLS